MQKSYPPLEPFHDLGERRKEQGENGRKLRLLDINEYFEAIFNAVSTSTARSWTGSNNCLRVYTMRPLCLFLSTNCEGFAMAISNRKHMDSHACEIVPFTCLSCWYVLTPSFCKSYALLGQKHYLQLFQTYHIANIPDKTEFNHLIRLFSCTFLL